MADDPAPVRRPTLARLVLAVGSVAVVWLCLTAPALVSDAARSPGFAHAASRIPIEGVLFVLVAWVSPPRWRRVWVVAGGVALTSLMVLTVADLSVGAAFDRRARLSDLEYLGSAGGLLVDSVGPVGAVVVGAIAVAGCVLLPFVLVRAVAALVHGGAAHPLPAAAVIAVLLAAWAPVGASTGPNALPQPVAAALVGEHLAQARADLREHDEVKRAIATPAPAAVAPLSALRGRDVVVIFVESYGRTALEGPAADVVLPGLAQADRTLQDAGYHSRSGFLTSPTLGGLSWLPHATLHSGVWIDTQQAHDELMTSTHPTLTRTFRDAGWRTVGVVPSNTEDWPAGASFYGFDTVHDARSIGYQGRSLGYARVPDQFTLATLSRLELTTRQGATTAPRQPVMAEVDLASSHTPWVPLPSLVEWTVACDPAGTAPLDPSVPSRRQAWSSPDAISAAYGRSIVYSVGSVASFAQAADDDLVIVLVGDHQPATVVSGENASHDVPVSVITRDATLLHRIDDWGWQPGLVPGPSAPLWRMDAFHDRFLTAFSGP